MGKKNKNTDWDAYEKARIAEEQANQAQNHPMQEVKTSPIKRAFLTLGECYRCAVTSFLMYLMIGTVILALEAFTTTEDLTDSTKLVVDWTGRIIGYVVCIAIAIFLNWYLAQKAGVKHYRMLLTGNIRRLNGITAASKEYKPYAEYSAYKGSLIGLCIASPMILLALVGMLPGCYTVCGTALTFIAPWAFTPASWIIAETTALRMLVCILFGLIPVVTSQAAYIVGKGIAVRDKQKRDRISEAGRGHKK